MLRFKSAFRIVIIKTTINMIRLLVSAIGVILTFCWIIYTAPDRPEKAGRLKNIPIKKINKSGSSNLNKANPTIEAANSIEQELPKKEKSFLFANALSR